MDPVKLPAGYRLPKGTTMADVRRLDQELLASEGLDAQSHKAKEGRKKTPPADKQHRESSIISIRVSSRSH